jgi:hypothetical protein
MKNYHIIPKSEMKKFRELWKKDKVVSAVLKEVIRYDVKKLPEKK